MNNTLQTQAAVNPSPRKALSIAAWAISVPLAAMLVMAGTSKLRGVPMMVGLFEAIGVGQWFRYVTGFLEVLGAGLLFVPRLSGVGATLLAAVMVGAIATHIFIVGGSFAVPLALLVAALFVAYVRRDRTLALLGR
jgi:putative oxidoreductase